MARRLAKHQANITQVRYYYSYAISMTIKMYGYKKNEANFWQFQ